MLSIETHALTKRYGEARGIDGVNLAVEQGAFYGFIVLNFETFFVCNALGNLRLCRIELLLHVADRLI